MNLLDLVQQDVSLVFRNGEHWGCCPFHGEKSPSFSVNEEKQIYSCFGCGAAGDTISYLRKKRGLSFRDAARMVGRELDALPNTAQQRRQELRERLLHEYRDWCRQQDRDEAERHGDLWREIEIAEIAYRASVQHPDWFTDDEAEYWALYLGDLTSARIEAEMAMAEQQLVSPDEQERQRFAQWQDIHHV